MVADDVRVTEGGDGSRLAQHACRGRGALLFAAPFREQDFQRDAAAEAGIERAVHAPHSPFAEHRLDDVAIDGVADGGHCLEAIRLCRAINGWLAGSPCGLEARCAR